MNIDFEKLWNVLSNRLTVEEANKGKYSNYIIRIPRNGIRIRVGNYGSDKVNDTYSNMVCISRHFVRKPIFEIHAFVKSLNKEYIVRTTADHTCMRIKDEYDDDGNFVFEQISASELKIGDNLCSCEVETWFGEDQCDTKANVTSISVDENKDGMWVYDLEVESSRHVYFANGLLVHNSQFINLSPVTKTMCKRAGISTDTIFSKLPDEVKQNVIDEAYRLLDIVNENAKNLINRNCYTNHGDVIHYALEYVASEGMYFKKKHYIVHKIISDDLPCDKFKYSGISVKKAEIPVSMKNFLKEIFENTMTREWTEADYRKEVEKAYNKFITLDWDDIAYYKKYRTVKRTLSLTESEKGAGVHARAANFYNMLISKEYLNLAGRYSKIGAGDEFRYSYVLPTNSYAMDCVAFKDIFPDEFRKIFKPDYELMFNKIFTKSLENYVRIMEYKTVDPTRQEEDPSFDIF